VIRKIIKVDVKVTSDDEFMRCGGNIKLCNMANLIDRQHGVGLYTVRVSNNLM